MMMIYNVYIMMMIIYYPYIMIMMIIFYAYIKVADCSRGRPEGSFFNSYYTKVQGRVLLLSQDCSTLPLIRIL